MKKQYTTPVIKFVQIKNEPLLGVMSPNTEVDGTTEHVPTEYIEVDENGNPIGDGMNG